MVGLIFSYYFIVAVTVTFCLFVCLFVWLVDCLLFLFVCCFCLVSWLVGWLLFLFVCLSVCLFGWLFVVVVFVCLFLFVCLFAHFSIPLLVSELTSGQLPSRFCPNPSSQFRMTALSASFLSASLSIVTSSGWKKPRRPAKGTRLCRWVTCQSYFEYNND